MIQKLMLMYTLFFIYIRLDVYFPADMSSIQSAEINIVDMLFGPNIPDSLKAELSKLYRSIDFSKATPAYSNSGHMRGHNSDPCLDCCSDCKLS